MKIIPMALAAFLLPLLPPASPSHTTECATEASVDFDGDGVDDVVAGDPFAAVDGLPGAGAVHVVSGRRTTMIGAPRPAGGDGFGWSVAVARLDDDACADLVVGAPYADVDGKTDAGAVYLLYGGAERDVRVVAPDPQEGAHFGWSVAATPDDGGVVAIGAPHEDDDGVRDAGAVYLLRADDPDTLTRISQESKGLIGNSETGDMFGWSLALGAMIGDADRIDLAVGAPHENSDGSGRQNEQGMADTGGCFVIRDPLASDGSYEGVKWEMSVVVAESADGEPPAQRTPGDRFGYAVSYVEGHLAVSAPLADVRGVADTGLVHVLRTDGREMVPGVTLFREEDAVPGDGFGFSVALGAVQGEREPRLAVGVPFARDGQGAVQLIRLSDPARSELLTAPGLARARRLGWSVAFSGNRLAAGVPDDGTGGGVGLLGRNQDTFTIVTPKTPANATAADTGASVAG